MSDILFKIPATIKKYSTMADRGVRMIIDSDRELSPPDMAALHMVLATSGTMGFVTSENQIDELDAMEVPEDILEHGQKSKSQRLRAVLALVAKEKHEDPDNFYYKEMERIIGIYKKRLPQIKEL